MFNIDNTSAIAQMPVPRAEGARGWFSPGDPSSGLAPTVLSADFLNIIQAELLAILDAASIMPSKTIFDQVLQAIKFIAAEVAQTDPAVQGEIASKVPSVATGSDSAIANLIWSAVIGAPLLFNGNTGYILPFSHTYGAAGFSNIANIVHDDVNRALKINIGNMSGGNVMSIAETAFGNVASGWFQRIGNIYQQVFTVPYYDSGTRIVFPTAFSGTPVVTISASPQAPNENIFAAPQVASLDATGFTVFAQDAPASGSPANSSNATIWVNAMGTV